MEFIPFSTNERAVTSMNFFLPIRVKVLHLCQSGELVWKYCGTRLQDGHKMVTAFDLAPKCHLCLNDETAHEYAL